MALLRFIEGALESAQTYETDGEQHRAHSVQRNPDKLARNRGRIRRHDRRAAMSQ